MREYALKKKEENEKAIAMDMIPALLPAPAAYQTYDSNKGRLIYSSIGDLSNLPNKRRKQS